MQLSKTEKWTLIIISILLCLGLILLAGGPIFSDEFLYLDLGLRNVIEPSYGNRYFHVYLQKLFVSILPTPLLGVRVFWSLLIAISTALVYFNARTITKDSSIIHGLLGVAFFFAFPLIKEYSGEPAVDITAMTMTVIYLSVYLWGVKNPKKLPKTLFLLGLLSFLSLKTKETTIFINILLAGFLIEKFKEKITIKDLFIYFRPFLIGIALGIGIFIILDSIFLGKPFFAIAPSTFGSIFTHYDFGAGFFNGPTSWYSVYFLDELLLPFILFLLGGVQLQNKVDGDVRIVWIYPLILAAFVSWNMLKIPWGFIERFYFPALPVIAILAPQVIRMELPSTKRSWIWFMISMLFAMLLAWFMRLYWVDVSKQYYFDYARMLDAVYYPILISLLLAILVWKNKFDWKWTIIQLFCIGSLLFSPLVSNYKYFVTFPKIKKRYSVLLHPFESFKTQFNVLEDDLVFVSGNIKEDQDMLSRDPNDIVGMYNFFFDARITRDNIFLGYDETKTGSNLSTREFSYVLLTESDIDQLKTENLWDEIIDNYSQIDSDQTESIFLLSN
jgi:hypothetical protein